MPKVGAALREAIKADGRSLRQLAVASGVDAGRLSRFVRGERDINLGAADHLLNTLGVKVKFPQRKAGRKAKPAKGGRPKRKKQ